MAKFKPPYGAKVYSIPYIPTVFEGREAVQYCPSCNQRVVLHRLKDFESFTGEEMEAHIEARHPGLIKEI